LSVKHAHEYAEACSAFLDSGELPDHLALLRTEYRSRRDALLSALDRRLAGAVR
jgi:DNA-binding transcriptional MocR family regulator